MVKLSSQDEKIRELHAEWDLFITQASMMSLLPIERWIEDLQRAESVAPITDPTLYRDYVYSGTGPDLIELFKAGLTLKQTILKMRERYHEQSHP